MTINIKNMKIDFKKELEQASRGMILIHDPALLIKLIIRMIVRKLGIRHSGMVLYDHEKDHYVLKISRGEIGYRIPQGFTRFDKDCPIIKVLMEKDYRPFTNGRKALVYNDLNKLIWQESVIADGNGTKELLCKVDDQMTMLNISACVPAYYRNNLLAVLLLGDKKDGTKYEQDELNFFAALASDTAMAIRNAQLFTNLEKELKKNRNQFIQTIIVLSSTIEAKDSYTHGHTERVTKISLSIAKQLANNGSFELDDKFYENIYISALLHDIGKIGIPETILLKKGPLTKEEFSLIKNHPVKGSEMIRPLDLHLDCIRGIRHHHERYDGLGYPGVYKGSKIPLTASIIAVADTFDAMTSDRPYRKGLPRETAINEIRNCSGTQFHPLVAQAMIELFKDGLI